jgi:hypothetical protein
MSGNLKAEFLENNKQILSGLTQLGKIGLLKEVNLIQNLDTDEIKIMGLYPQIDVSLKFVSISEDKMFWFHKTSPILQIDSAIHPNYFMNEKTFIDALVHIHERTIEYFLQQGLPIKRVAQGMYLLNSTPNFEVNPTIYPGYASIGELMTDFIKNRIKSEKILTFLKYGYPVDEAVSANDLPLHWIQKLHEDYSFAPKVFNPIQIKMVE